MITTIACMALMSPAQLAAQPEHIQSPAAVVQTVKANKTKGVNTSTNFTQTFGNMDDANTWD